ncbi:hypothetical protein [Natrinema versiforme]|uniref:Lipoprotein n=1 Tax=Natrinema versiforme TaxID=88724 RepID=A0A4V6MBF6_9EURY|nr:hypothetical protein [Natrinema versiforme]QCS40836.1 hypothetical protein FEJ81_00180 [Natrinema versiforme]
MGREYRRTFAISILAALSGCGYFREDSVSCPTERRFIIKNNDDITHNIEIKITDSETSEIVFEEVRAVGPNKQKDFSHLLSSLKEYEVTLKVESLDAEFKVSETTACAIVKSSQKIDIIYNGE